MRLMQHNTEYRIKELNCGKTAIRDNKKKKINGKSNKRMEMKWCLAAICELWKQQEQMEKIRHFYDDATSKQKIYEKHDNNNDHSSNSGHKTCGTFKFVWVKLFISIFDLLLIYLRKKNKHINNNWNLCVRHWVEYALPLPLNWNFDT